MSQPVRKIINDPVYGFITIDNALVYAILSHPWYQRLRRIHQMALAQLVYPGAIHTRLHHSLGAFHLMCSALQELRNKGVPISAEEEEGAKAAILLHDVGHGPYSHALENVLVEGVHHETLSLLIMRSLNETFQGRLSLAIDIFTNNYQKPFLHQLVSGQLDVDRMDYLCRDSFFTGVSEGEIAYDRILKMLTVHNDHLMIEEKGIYSIEKFLVSRRLMYWQVYLHKTVLSAEKMLVKVMRRAKELICNGRTVAAASPTLDFFLRCSFAEEPIHAHLDKFCLLDDYDVLTSVKNWMFHDDRVLSILSRCLIERRLFKVKFHSEPVDPVLIKELRAKVCEHLHICDEDAGYFVSEGQAENTTYNPVDERINILFKDGRVRDISQVDNALIQHNLSTPVKRYYVCYMQVEARS